MYAPDGTAGPTTLEDLDTSEIIMRTGQVMLESTVLETINDELTRQKDHYERLIHAMEVCVCASVAEQVGG